VQKSIKDGDPAFSLSDNFYLRALYENATGNPEDVQKGFLRSRLLVQVSYLSRFIWHKLGLNSFYRRSKRFLRRLRPPPLASLATKTPLR